MGFVFLERARPEKGQEVTGIVFAFLASGALWLIEPARLLFEICIQSRAQSFRWSIFVMFGISVSGIKNSQKHLDVTSNNIANANTYGFKKSRAEFADMYASSLYSSGKTNVGLGVQNTVVSQQFTQGSLSGDTGNGLDMAIQGNGFFVLSGDLTSSGHTYTRNGAFHTNNEGYIVTATEDYLQGWDVNPDGTSSSLDLNATHPIQIPSDTGAPKESNSISIGVNLPADSDPLKPVSDGGTGQITWGGANVTLQPNDLQYGRYLDENGALQTPTAGTENNYVKQYFSNFDPADSSTYTNTTSQTIHDSLGRAHTLTYYMLNMGESAANSNESTWVVIPFVDGQPVDIAPANGEQPTLISTVEGNNSGANYFGFRINFDANGEMISDSTVPSNVTFAQADATQGAGASIRNGLLTAAGVTDINFPDLTVDANGTLGSLLTGANQAQNLALDFNATQYGSSKFKVSVAPTNDGYATGNLLSVSVDENGVIYGEYSNGIRQAIAKIAMADFTNTQGLTKESDTQWSESMSSGPAIASEANTGTVGSIIGSNLEMSNVDLTSELVELITAQRNYQANAQSLQTQNTVMDSILSIR